MSIHCADSMEALLRMEPNTIDALVTDPPAGISFMGKAWDSDKGGRDEWVAWMAAVMRECLRVMKPGAHGLVWALPRTSHWTTTACEDAGFEIRDIVLHLFGSGFPKSLDVSKAIDKAAGAEREVVATIKKTPSAGSPGMNEGWQRPWAQNHPKTMDITAPSTDAAKQWQGWGTALKPAAEHWILIRKPCSEKTVAANVLKWGCGALNIDGSRIESDGSHHRAFVKKAGTDKKTYEGQAYANDFQPTNHAGRFPSHLILDEHAAELLDEQSGMQASRFYYCAKISSSERNSAGPNGHPTVKAQKLMRYLCKLVTPPGGTILDPFTGSGSTGVAAKALGFKFIGIDREAEYCEIAERRMEAVRVETVS